MICNGAPTPVWPLLESYNQWYRWNLAMLYAGCVLYHIPTDWLDHYNDLISHDIE